MIGRAYTFAPSAHHNPRRPSPYPTSVHFCSFFKNSFRINRLLISGCNLLAKESERRETVLVSSNVSSFFKRSKLTRISHFLFYCSMFSLIFVFVYGRLLSQIVTDLSKLTVGRLSPSFMAACNANLTEAGCQGYVIRYKGYVHRGSF